MDKYLLGARRFYLGEFAQFVLVASRAGSVEFASYGGVKKLLLSWPIR